LSRGEVKPGRVDRRPCSQLVGFGLGKRLKGSIVEFCTAGIQLNADRLGSAVGDLNPAGNGGARRQVVDYVAARPRVVSAVGWGVQQPDADAGFRLYCQRTGGGQQHQSTDEQDCQK